MRAHPVPRAAAAALAAALSGSLALGAADSAFAAPGSAARTSRAAASQVEATAEQFRVLEDLGRLSALTGRLGRLAHDRGTDARVLRGLRDRIRAQLEQLAHAVDRARPRTLPIADPAPGRPAPERSGPKRPGHRARLAPQARLLGQPRTFAQARKGFEAAVDRTVEVATARGGASDAQARTAASDALARELAAVDDAALAESGIRPRTGGDRAVHTLPAPARAAVTGLKSAPSTAVSGADPFAGAYADPFAHPGASGRGQHATHRHARARAGFSQRLFEGRTLEDAGSALAPVARLVKDVRAARNGTLDARRLARHSRDVARTFAPLRHKARNDARRGRALAELRKRTHVLLESARHGDSVRVAGAARKLTGPSAVYLRTAGGGVRVDGTGVRAR